MNRTAILYFMLLGLAVFIQPAMASDIQSKNVKTLKYTIDVNQTYVSPIALAMADLYSGTRYDQTKPYSDKPMMGVAVFDLNKDGSNDYIAYPIEEFHEEGHFCTLNSTICPHYILLSYKKDTSLKIIGIINANSLDVGEHELNGFKILKAFTMEDEAVLTPKSFGFYDTYKFDADKGEYINAMIPPKKKTDKKK